MKYNGFYDIEHMRSYLRGSVIRIENTPIYVHEVDQRRNQAGKPVEKICYFPLGSENNDRIINVKSKRINLEPVPLGFLNMHHQGELQECVVISRIPYRAWKIGLTQNNMNVSVVAGKSRQGRTTSTGTIITSESLRKTIMNEYPNYEQAQEQVAKGSMHTACAFNRHFAVQRVKTKQVLLYYKFPVVVGTVKDSGPILKPEFDFLREHMEEVCNVG